MRIAICIYCTYPALDKKFVTSLLVVLEQFHLYNTSIGGLHEIQIFMQNEGFYDYARQKLAETAIKAGYDYLLWFDTDQVNPPFTIVQMIKDFEADKKLEAVTGLYTWKTPPFLPHVYFKYDKKDGKFRIAAGFPLNRLFFVEGAGYGILMIKASVYKRTKKPWFKFVYGKMGEDLYFFKKVQPIRMVCDPRISSQHLTQTAINIDGYLKYTNLKVVDGNIQVSKADILKIDKFWNLRHKIK